MRGSLIHQFMAKDNVKVCVGPCQKELPSAQIGRFGMCHACEVSHVKRPMTCCVCRMQTREPLLRDKSIPKNDPARYFHQRCR